MNNGILSPGYAPPISPRPLLGLPQPVPVPYAQPEVDPFYDNVALHLRMDGPHGSRTFTDLSRNRLGVIARGTAQISERQSRFYATSALFNGSSDFLNAPDTGSFFIRDGDFTIEAHVFLTAFSPAYGGIAWRAGICAKDENGTGRSFNWTIRGTATSYTSMGIEIYSAQAASTDTTANFTFALNRWYYVAVTRRSGSVRLYVDGVDIGGGTNTRNAQANSVPFTVGTINYSGFEYWFPGHISDFRFTKGVARYTANFAPPTRPYPTTVTPAFVRSGPATDPFWSNVSLLLPMDGDNNSTTFTDASDSKLTGTANGNAKISTAQAKFGRSSAEFDGTGDWVEVAANSAFSFGTADWTAECWFRINGDSAADNNGNRDADLMSVATSSPAQVSFTVGLRGNSTTTGTKISYYQNTPSVVDVQRDVTVTQQEWHHIAVTRSSNTLRLFLDGTQIGASATITAASGDSTRPFRLGRLGFSGFLHEFNGNIADVRITPGIARYTANFTPPAAPLPTLPSFPAARRTADPNWNNVSLLLRMDGASGSTTFTDLSNNAFPVTVLGSAAVSTAQAKYGGGSLLCDAVNKGLQVPAGTAFAYGTGDFTMEGWIYRTASADGAIFSQVVSGTNYVLFSVTAAGQISFIGATSGGGTSIFGPAGTLAALNTWAHVAVVRSNGSITVYCDGVGGTPSTANGAAVNYTDTTRIPTIGRYTHDGSLIRFQGYIDEFRITKGVARYTANFTPPTSQFPEY